MSATIFVGPSVEPQLVRSVFQGEICPPIKRGDLDRLLDTSSPPSRVGIVDGQFLHAVAISPKEVLRALDHGVQVYGSSSMGALRAVECLPFGMVGIGLIFRLYASGELDADDEVGIIFDPQSLVALSEPMVNIRIALQAAMEAAVVSASTAEMVTAKAKELYFPDRTYANVLRIVRGAISETEHAALAAFLNGGTVPNQKRADALELIETMNLSAFDSASGVDTQ